MSIVTIPLIFAVLGLLAGIIAFRSIRLGMSRFYALERETMLRRANSALLGSLLLFLISVGWLVNIQRTASLAEQEAAQLEAQATPTPQIDSLTIIDPNAETDVEKFPPTPEPSPTIDPNLPTPTPTPFLRRGLIVDTGGSGAYLREAPTLSSEDLLILSDGAIVIIDDDFDPVDAEGIKWVRVFTPQGDEGWVADWFLEIQDP